MSGKIVMWHRIQAAAVFVVALIAVTAGQVQPAKPPAGVQGPLRGGYTEAGTLPARILDFKAEPASIKPGESTTLTWAVENPRSTSIDPTIGRAAPRGVLKITPKATTTYTLTVTGTGTSATHTATVSLTVSGGGTTTNLIVNGGFETVVNPQPRANGYLPYATVIDGWSVNREFGVTTWSVRAAA